MLATLPTVGDLVAEQAISASTRKAITSVVSTIYECRSDHIMFKMVGYTITGAILILTLALWMWQPLIGVISIALVPLQQKKLTSRRITGVRVSTLTALQQPGFQHNEYLELVAHLDWKPICLSDKEKLLAIVGATG